MVLIDGQEAKHITFGKNPMYICKSPYNNEYLSYKRGRILCLFLKTETKIIIHVK